MAGFYPDVPGPRMAYHLDGSSVWTLNSTYTLVSSEVTPLECSKLNSENLGEVFEGRALCLIFPELRNLSGISMAGPGGGFAEVQWSADTTNGVDGVWSFAAPGSAAQGNTKTDLREQIYSLGLTGVKAIRTRTTGYSWIQNWTVLHVYGQIIDGQLDQRLKLWHPTLDVELDGAYFDWGDVSRGTAETRTFRVKNFSTVMTAGAINVSLSHLTDATPTLTGQSALSSASSPTQEASKAIGSLAPGVISEVLTLHRSTSNTAALSLWWSLITAAPATWSA